MPLILYDKKMLSMPVFYISSYLEKSRPVYYERLTAISRDDDWNGWIEFFLQAIVEQAEENSSKAVSIIGLYKKMKESIPVAVHVGQQLRADVIRSRAHPAVRRIIVIVRSLLETTCRAGTVNDIVVVTVPSSFFLCRLHLIL